MPIDLKYSAIRAVFTAAAAAALIAAAGCRDWFLPEGEPPAGPIVTVKPIRDNAPVGAETAVNRAADGLTDAMLGEIASGTRVAIRANSPESEKMAFSALRRAGAFIAVTPVLFSEGSAANCVLRSEIDGKTWTLRLALDGRVIYDSVFTLR
ncbi:MAG: hypothetical protein PHI85_03595 [Victivallaceae bacterium]|nr:hypothetical protein [Victivallaceae bacterium]